VGRRARASCEAVTPVLELFVSRLPRPTGPHRPPTVGVGGCGADKSASGMPSVICTCARVCAPSHRPVVCAQKPADVPWPFIPTANLSVISAPVELVRPD
jgi:hypothetical protein